EQLSAEEERGAAQFISQRLEFAPAHPDEPERPAPLPELPAPRLHPPGSLSEICFTDDYERALHTYGRSYRDVVRAFRGKFDHPPDVVARPREEAEVRAVLDWALGEGAAVIPFGGGTSVVGGVEPNVGDRYEGTVTIDLKALDRLLEVDAVSGAARI